MVVLPAPVDVYKRQILLSEEEFRGMVETIYLLNSEGMAERVEEARRTPIEESDDFAW